MFEFLYRLFDVVRNGYIDVTPRIVSSESQPTI